MDKTPKFLARAEFSSDMIDTLQKFFEQYEIDGVVSVEVTSQGLWLPNPETGGRQFLGLAKDETPPTIMH